MRRLGDFAHQVARLVLVHHVAGRSFAGLPYAVLLDCLHERIRDTNAVVCNLKEDAAVCLTVDGTVISRIDESPGLYLLLRLALDELRDIRVIDVEDHHFRRPASLAAALDDSRESVKPLHEADRP